MRPLFMLVQKILQIAIYSFIFLLRFGNSKEGGYKTVENCKNNSWSAQTSVKISWFNIDPEFVSRNALGDNLEICWTFLRTIELL